MLLVDFVGILFTTALIGFRYWHYVASAVFLHEMGRILMAVFLHQHIENVIIAGAFGKTTVSSLNAGFKETLIIFSGPLTNYVVGATAGGLEFERTDHLINPFAKLRHPFAVVNIRLAITSGIINLLQFL